MHGVIYSKGKDAACQKLLIHSLIEKIWVFDGGTGPEIRANPLAHPGPGTE